MVQEEHYSEALEWFENNGIVPEKRSQYQTHFFIEKIKRELYDALLERGYNPVNQICGYLLSGDPTYIFAHKNVRIIIQHYEREELLEELFRTYIADKDYSPISNRVGGSD